MLRCKELWQNGLSDHIGLNYSSFSLLYSSEYFTKEGHQISYLINLISYLISISAIFGLH